MKFVVRLKYLIEGKLCLVIVLLVFSCSNTAAEKEEAFIKSRILNHVNTFGLKFIIDSLNKRTHLKALRLLHGEPGAKADIYCDSVMAIRYKNRNSPYRLSLDANLTYEKFMDFCHKNKLDPVKTARELK